MTDLEQEIGHDWLTGAFEVVDETCETAFVIPRLLREALRFDQHLSERATVKGVNHAAHPSLHKNSKSSL
jgi:hypothetical protein